MIDDGVVRRRDTQPRIRGCQSHGTFGLKMNTIMNFVEPDKRLTFAVRSILTSVNLNDFVRAILGRQLQRILNVIPRKNMEGAVGESDAGFCCENKKQSNTN